jgi:F420-dependent oxidoreductase-like protein
MRIGLFAHVRGFGLDASLPELLRRFERAEADGFASVWSAHLIGDSYDALTLLALAGQVTKTVELGTSVIPTYPHHPAALAQQALTVQEATGNRLILGIGLSHQPIIEDMLGLDFSKPVRHMREYLTVLAALLSGGAVDFRGDEYRVHMRLDVPETTPPPILVAALGPQLLKLAGSLTDGIIPAFGGPRYLAQAIPQVRAAAQLAGRPAPRIAACFPVAVADDHTAARAAANERFGPYVVLPSYRRALDIEGSADVAGAVILGTEAEVANQVKHLTEVGVTDLVVSPFAIDSIPGTVERTYECLADLARSSMVRPS